MRSACEASPPRKRGTWSRTDDRRLRVIRRDTDSALASASDRATARASPPFPSTSASSMRSSIWAGLVSNRRPAPESRAFRVALFEARISMALVFHTVPAGSRAGAGAKPGAFKLCAGFSPLAQDSSTGLPSRMVNSRLMGDLGTTACGCGGSVHRCVNTSSTIVAWLTLRKPASSRLLRWFSRGDRSTGARRGVLRASATAGSGCGQTGIPAKHRHDNDDEESRLLWIGRDNDRNTGAKTAAGDGAGTATGAPADLDHASGWPLPARVSRDPDQGAGSSSSSATPRSWRPK